LAIAIAIASLAVVLTGIQAWEAHRARVDAKATSDAQSKDVERSRKAAEDSVTAANRGADAAWNSVQQLAAIAATGRAQISSSERMFSVEQLPSIGLDGAGFAWFVDKSPRMDPSKPTEMKITLSNAGKAAFDCQMRFGGKFSNPTESLDEKELVLFPGILDLSTNASLTVTQTISASSSLPASSGEVRLPVWQCEMSQNSDS
jgi:hypothetical protein